MGVPWETMRATMRLRIWRSLRHRMSASSHSPSAPQFQEKLSLLPAWQASALRMGCLRPQPCGWGA